MGIKIIKARYIKNIQNNIKHNNADNYFEHIIIDINKQILKSLDDNQIAHSIYIFVPEEYYQKIVKMLKKTGYSVKILERHQFTSAIKIKISW